MVALRAQVPVVPVGLIGTNRLLPYGRNVPRFVREPLLVRFGPPISFADLWQPTAENRVPPRAAIEAATARVEAAIRTLLGES
jgi:1-acyl-sn-glycerol-3-phosphate acyltransferase